MILHVAGLDKFIPPFVRLIEEEFNDEDHKFWLAGFLKKYSVEKNENVYVCGSRFLDKAIAYAKLIRQLHSARKVMLHGLFNIRVVLLLALCPWVLPKCYWIIWGGDLYQYENARKSLSSRVDEVLRRFVIRRLGHLVTYIQGDVDLARQWYGAKGVHHECLMYTSNVVDPSIVSTPIEKKQDGALNILVGNSAASSNNHFEALARLLPYKDNDIKIFVPLSYGDKVQADKVIMHGKEWFGEKFLPMTNFIPFEQYLDFLKNIDIAVFNHQRQQAMGNTITLLGMGKTVFMRNDVSQWRFLNSLGLKINDVANLELQPLKPEEAKENSQIVKSYFSKSTLVKQFSGIFEG